MKQKELERKLLELIRNMVDGFFLQEVGSKMVDIIYKRVKSGGGVQDDSVEPGTAKRKALKKLSNSYKDVRKKKPPTGEFASAAKSNLTNTGQMLNAMNYRVTSKGVTVYMANSGRSDGKNTNRKVAGYVAENGRPFFNITDGELRIIQQLFAKHITKKLKEFK